MTPQEHLLMPADLDAVPSLRTRVLVIGSGVAGLSAALRAAEDADVLLATKGKAQETNTWDAQGGVAASLPKDDSAQSHIDDTIRAGGGLCDLEAVTVLAEEGIERCRQLVEWGTPFDRRGGELAYTMEGGHSQRRVLHASGDATGRAIHETLYNRVQENERIRVLEEHFAIDLLVHEGECFGAMFLSAPWGRLLRIEADATVLASGGMGQVYRETTNPEVATGDGLAMAYRAGAVLRDMEFIQFHPTTLYLAGAPRFLISESVRGEGARLVTLQGEPFMAKYSADKELAPRDVVSQSIIREMRSTGATHVCLDLRHMGEELVERRFPTIRRICADFGIDVIRDLVPVRPSAHYAMGGVRCALDASTRVRRLFVAGEVASVGVHGANRLASNSLLEGLVFGWRAGASAIQLPHAVSFPLRHLRRKLEARSVPLDIEDVQQSLRSLMWRKVGIYRSEEQLNEARQTIRSWENYVLAEQFQARAGFEIQNMLTVAKVIARSALSRRESRGAHQRLDYPDSSPAWQHHTEIDSAMCENE